MGKTKDLEKKQKISEEKETQKIKRGIFKAFQARLSSPGQGGALIVAEPKQSNVTNRKHGRTKRPYKTVLQISSESNSSSPDSMSDHKKNHKSRKSNFTKKKRSSTSKSTARKEKADTDTAVSKHMRIAHGITAPSTTMKDKSMINFNMMARNRVSQKVGLISTGKKGAPASKALIIPEHISRQVDEGIKKLVKEAEADIQSSGDLNVAETMVLSKCRPTSTNRSTPASAHSIPSASCSIERVYKNTTPHEVTHGIGQNIFPEELPIKETVLYLLSSLKNSTRQFYAGRNFLQETLEQLLKCYKQNTIQSTTPTTTPGYSDNITRSGSIKRSLIDMFDNEQLETPTDRHYNKHRQLIEPQCAGDSRQIKGSRYHEDLDSVMSKHSHCDRVLNSLSTFREKQNPILDTRNPMPDRRGDRSREILEEIRSFIDSGKLVASLNDGSHKKRLKLGNNEAFNPCVDSRNSHGSEQSNRNSSKNCDGKSAMERFYADINGEDLQVQQNNMFEASQREPTFFDTFESNSFGNNEFFLRSNKPMTPEVQMSPILMWANGSQEERCDTMNAQHLLAANEAKKTVAPLEPRLLRHEPTVTMTEPMDTDATSLLEQNDKVMEILTDHKSNHIPPPPVTFDRGLVDDIVRHSRSNSQCSYNSQESSYHRNTVKKSSCKHVNYMPSFHDNYYLDHLGTGDLTWEQKPQKQKVEAMDILDYIDQQVYTESEMDGMGDRMVEIHSTVSPRYNTIPEWRTNNPAEQKNRVLPPPPSSPGGPKFYPKKMY